MEQENLKKVELAVENLKNKTSRIYFFVQDTKGNAKASIAHTYRMAMALRKNGYNSIMLHETKDYFGVGNWLGEEFMSEIPHESVDGGELKVSPEDFLIIPERYGFVMEQIKNLPCGKVVLSQSYNDIFETLQPGQSWSQFGFYKCLTTSEKQKEYLESIMRSVTFDVIEPLISSEFEKPELPPKTIISIHTKEHRDTINIIKAFYTKFPQYRWITFKDMRGLSVSEFAEGFKESFMSVWIDINSSFGTFPLESMKSGVPVVGLAPNLIPEWMNEDNGIWLNNQNMIVDVIADFIQNWLEDNINPELYEGMDKTVSQFSDITTFESNVVTVFDKWLKTRLENFESQLTKLETID
jgi:hypothetical protein